MARFSSANAREMAARSVTVRKAAEDQRLAEVNSAAQVPLPTGQDTDREFFARRLDRVRKQLSLTDDAIEKEARKATPDGQQLNSLAQAQSRLSEQERILSGRELPGVRKERRPTRAELRENSRAEGAGCPEVLGYDEVLISADDEDGAGEMIPQPRVGEAETVKALPASKPEAVPPQAPPGGAPPRPRPLTPEEVKARYGVRPPPAPGKPALPPQ